MSYRYFIKAFILITCVFTGVFSACSSQATQNTNFDPAKKYAAFAVVNLPASASILANAKQQSTADGLEIGPIEYYSSQTKDFDPIVKKLTVSKQITVIWVVGGLMDVPSVRKSATKFGFAGTTRFMPVSDQSLPGQ